jgi:predicted acetyltransferase
MPSNGVAERLAMQLVVPALEHLPSYVEALNRGWSPDNIRGRAAALDELAEIEKDRQAFVARLVDREAKGAPVTLPDGSTRPRLPGYRLWMWDGEFCGSIGLRWQAGTSELPEWVLGHIGYAVVPWKSRRGYGTLALAQMLENARAEGLEYVEITTDLDNDGSRRVIERNGGVLVGRFRKAAHYGGKESLRYRIDLTVKHAPGQTPFDDHD